MVCPATLRSRSERPDGVAFDGQLLGRDRLLEGLCPVIIDALREDQNHRHLGG